MTASKKQNHTSLNIHFLLSHFFHFTSLSYIHYFSPTCTRHCLCSMTVGYFYWVAAPTTLAICCNFLTGIVDVTASTTLSEPPESQVKAQAYERKFAESQVTCCAKKICLENSALYASNCYCCFFVLLHSMETALNNTSSLEIHYCLDVPPPDQRVVTCFTLCAADTHTYVPGASHVRLADVCSRGLEPCMKGKSG